MSTRVANENQRVPLRVASRLTATGTRGAKQNNNRLNDLVSSTHPLTALVLGFAPLIYRFFDQVRSALAGLKFYSEPRGWPQTEAEDTDYLNLGYHVGERKRKRRITIVGANKKIPPPTEQISFPNCERPFGTAFANCVYRVTNHTSSRRMINIGVLFLAAQRPVLINFSTLLKCHMGQECLAMYSNELIFKSPPRWVELRRAIRSTDLMNITVIDEIYDQ